MIATTIACECFHLASAFVHLAASGREPLPRLHRVEFQAVLTSRDKPEIP